MTKSLIRRLLSEGMVDLLFKCYAAENKKTIIFSINKFVFAYMYFFSILSLYFFYYYSCRVDEQRDY